MAPLPHGSSQHRCCCFQRCACCPWPVLPCRLALMALLPHGTASFHLQGGNPCFAVAHVLRTARELAKECVDDDDDDKAGAPACANDDAWDEISEALLAYVIDWGRKGYESSSCEEEGSEEEGSEEECGGGGPGGRWRW